MIALRLPTVLMPSRTVKKYNACWPHFGLATSSLSPNLAAISFLGLKNCLANAWPLTARFITSFHALRAYGTMHLRCL